MLCTGNPCRETCKSTTAKCGLEKRLPSLGELATQGLIGPQQNLGGGMLLTYNRDPLGSLKWHRNKMQTMMYVSHRGLANLNLSFIWLEVQVPIKRTKAGFWSSGSFFKYPIGWWIFHWPSHLSEWSGLQLEELKDTIGLQRYRTALGCENFLRF